MAPRHIAMALDFSASSKYAIKWALENLIKERDDILLVVVQRLNDESGLSNLWGDTGSPLVPFESLKDPQISRQYELEHDSALMDELEAAALKKQLTINLKVYYGDAKLKITEAMLEHSVDILIMGNRGQSGIKRILLGSVSNYVVNHVTCPVTVVKLPESPL